MWRQRNVCTLALLIIFSPGLTGCERGPQTIPGMENAGKPAEEKKPATVAKPRPEPALSVRTVRAFREWGVRETAADALARIGDAAVPALIETLADPEDDVRAQAARALARMGAKAEPAVPALIAALNDANRDVRQGAARALGQIGSAAEEAVPALIEAIKDPRNKPKREAVEVETKVVE